MKIQSIDDLASIRDKLDQAPGSGVLAPQSAEEIQDPLAGLSQDPTTQVPFLSPQEQKREKAKQRRQEQIYKRMEKEYNTDRYTVDGRKRAYDQLMQGLHSNRISADYENDLFEASSTKEQSLGSAMGSPAPFDQGYINFAHKSGLNKVADWLQKNATSVKWHGFKKVFNDPRNKLKHEEATSILDRYAQLEFIEQAYLSSLERVRVKNGWTEKQLKDKMNADMDIGYNLLNDLADSLGVRRQTAQEIRSAINWREDLRNEAKRNFGEGTW